MIVLAIDPGTRMGWATNSTAHHRGQRGVFDLDDWVSEWYGPEVVGYSKDDLLARRLASTRRIAHSTLAHVIVPDCFVVERQLAMAGKNRMQLNQFIETALVEVAGFLDIMLLRPTPSMWQAWARRHFVDVIEGWQALGKPDDLSAYMMLEWALATQKMEAVVA